MRYLRLIWMTLSVPGFLRCWLAFGRRGAAKSSLSQSFSVIGFETFTNLEFRNTYAPDQMEAPTSEYISAFEAALQFDRISCIKLRGPPLEGDTKTVVGREAWIFGHHSQNDPTLILESFVVS